MCGIVGIHSLTEKHTCNVSLLKRMLSRIRHRGPDEFGVYQDARIGMGIARLSIIDLSGGSQPISNEDETVWIVFNGEIFNYIELRSEMKARGHQFRTASDTEVVVHLYEEYGVRCLDFLNGQFAFAMWDTRPGAGLGKLFMARDRVGICPLFYTLVDGKLVFGSEIKSILEYPAVLGRIDVASLAQIFRLWTTMSPRTVFKDIFEIPPAHYLLAQDGDISVEPYWELTFPDREEPPALSDEEYIETLRDLLVDSTRIRLRADVPVGSYLSGGLDSSATTAIIRNNFSNYLRTFSIVFDDPNFDERQHQERMVDFLHTDHHRIEINDADVGELFPKVIWHTEWPILRTAPTPLYKLSQLVRESDFKVVLTGEGSDEFLGGYNIYKEAKLRRFWANEPDSELRPLLLRRLYPYVQGLGQQEAYLRAFFRRNLNETGRLDYSHAIRWANTASLQRFFSSNVQEDLNGYDPVAEINEKLEHHHAFARWTPLAQAQYIEVSIFLSEYLLSSQGDRMLMSHSVEGRFPFMDHRVIEFAGTIPPRLKIFGMNEKYILKRAMRNTLPESIWRRTKRPYRAPIHRSFFGEVVPEYVSELLSAKAIRDAGYFNQHAVAGLVKKAQGEHPLSERDNMSLVGVLSTQLVHNLFIENFAHHYDSTEQVVLHKHCIGSTNR